MVIIESADIYVNGVPVVPYGCGWKREDFSIGVAEKFYSVAVDDFEKLLQSNYKKFSGCEIEKIEVLKYPGDEEPYIGNYFIAKRTKRGDIKKCFIMNLGEWENDN